MTTVPRTLGKYQIVGLVGRGGMGEVYKAFQPDLNRHVAIKTMIAGEQASEDFLRRFQREARLAAQVIHPNIVQIHDFGNEGKLYYLVMEYVEGKSLRQLLTDKKLDVAKSLKIVHTVLRALQFAHDQKVVHRDIKPANVLIDKQGRVRILDFGLAKSLLDGKGVTVSGDMVGTPNYMAPEQAFGAPEEVDGRADLYSVGAMLYEMVTGTAPFDGPTVLAVLRKIEEESPPPPGITPRIDALILKALAKDRRDRFQTATEMADEVKACIPGSPSDRIEVSPPEPVKPGRSRMPLNLALAVAFLIAGAFVTWRFWPKSSSTSSPPKDGPPSVDLDAELSKLLSRNPDPDDGELSRFVAPHQQRKIADQLMRRGHYGRAAKHLQGYDRSMCELSSASSLQRFVSPGLFPVTFEPPQGLKGAEAFLAAAIERHLTDKPVIAREKLDAAVAAHANPAHVLLVRAHLTLCDIWNDPLNEANRPALLALRKELEKFGDPFLLPLRALCFRIEGDTKSAWETADGLRRLAPNAAESFVLRALLHRWDANYEAAIEALEDARRLDPEHFDPSPHRCYVRWLMFLASPGSTDPRETRPALDALLSGENKPPMALLLRGVLNAFESSWDAAQVDLKMLLEWMGPAPATLDSGLLGAFLWIGASKSRIQSAAADLLSSVGAGQKALAIAQGIKGDDVPEAERRDFLRDNHLWIARRTAMDEPVALHHVEEALKLGATGESLRTDEKLAPLRIRGSFHKWLVPLETKTPFETLLARYGQ